MNLELSIKIVSTNYTDAQVVLQMRLNMDSDLKCAIDTNFHDQWSAFNVSDAVKAVGSIINPVVYRKEFDKQHTTT